MFAIERIDVHLRYCKNFTEYKLNITVKAAVERELAIIGEAATFVKKIHPDISITSLKKIIAFRNLIIHAYDSVNDDTVWTICKKHIPTLKEETEKILNTT